MAGKGEFSTPSETEISFVQHFAVDLERIWAIWTQAQHLQQWWGPMGWTTPVCEVDFRPGGTWFYCMQDPDGNRHCGKMIYGDIDAPRRFTSIDVFTDDDGNVTGDLPESLVSYEFSEADGVTTVINITRYDTLEMRDQIIEMGVEAGINRTMDRLYAYLATLN